MTTRILLVDDHRIVREGLRSLIEKEPDLKIIGEAEDGRAAVKLATELKPDIVVMDLTMPEMNGMIATAEILRTNPEIKVLILSMHADRRFVAETLSAGASGYLLKDRAFSEMVKAIQAIQKGEVFLSPEITRLVVQDYKSKLGQETAVIAPELSKREREVLQMVAEGCTTKEIATALGVSIKTIESHRQQLMAKLKVDSVAELTKYAIREGLTSY
jgi:DNA-binding NarL/FixJ family response regulator